MSDDENATAFQRALHNEVNGLMKDIYKDAITERLFAPSFLMSYMAKLDAMTPWQLRRHRMKLWITHPFNRVRNKLGYWAHGKLHRYCDEY